jgi:hypothetical protein
MLTWDKACNVFLAALHMKITLRHLIIDTFTVPQWLVSALGLNFKLNFSCREKTNLAKTDNLIAVTIRFPFLCLRWWNNALLEFLKFNEYVTQYFIMVCSYNMIYNIILYCIEMTNLVYELYPKHLQYLARCYSEIWKLIAIK